VGDRKGIQLVKNSHLQSKRFSGENCEELTQHGVISRKIGWLNISGK